VLWRRCLDGALLLPPAAEEVIRLSASAAAIWEELAVESAVSTTDIADAFARDYDRSSSSLVPEVELLLHALTEQGAVESVP